MIYKDNIKFGIVIGTYRSIPYVHLGLESIHRNNAPVKVLINDDLSDEKEKLETLCYHYKCELSFNKEINGHIPGDLSAFYNGLKWANENDIDLLVKFSRRWVPIINWVPGLEKLAKETQANTFSSICLNLNWGFRSECVGMHVKTWLEAMPKIEAEMGRKKENGYIVEKFIHDTGKDLPQCEEYKEWDRKNPREQWRTGYAPWSHIGQNRIVLNPEAYWHHSRKPKDYCELSKSWGLNYSEKDFNNPLDKLGG